MHADETAYDISTGVAVLTGHARVEYGSALLLADEIRYNQGTGQVSASGHLSVTAGSRRLLAASGTYNLTTGVFELKDLRAGEPPVYITAEKAAGTKFEMILTGATVTYNEPGGFAPTLRADRLVYRPGEKISGEHASLGLGGRWLVPVPKFDQPLGAAMLPLITVDGGYRGSLGAFLDLGLRIPVWPGVNLGADVGEYTARGPMAGPSGSYHSNTGGQDITGSFDSGFISDHGARGTDILGRNVPEDRGYFDWSHRQVIDGRLTLTGEFNWWGDSAVLRDFHPNEFYPVQQPDSFFEGAYAGDNYYVDFFTRVAPNNFEIVQQRLPEIRFDLVPTAIGGGFYERLNTGFASLEEDTARQRLSTHQPPDAAERPLRRLLLD